MTQRLYPRGRQLLAAALAGACCAPAAALELGTSMVYQYQSSDNIDRVDQTQSAEDGARNSLLASLSGSTRGRVLSMDFDLDVVFSEDDGERGDTSDVDARGGLYALFALRPGQISWLFANYVVQQGDDLAALSNSDERFRANFFVTGPATSWRLTPVDTLNLDLFYLLADEEGDPEQARQLALQTNWVHRFTKQHALGLHVDQSEIDYKVSADEFSITNVYARYDYEHGRTRFNVDLGRSSSEDSSADPDSGAIEETDSDESLYRVGFSRQMSRELSLSFNASQVFTEESFSTLRDVQSDLVNGVDSGDGPYYEKRVALGLAREDAIWYLGLDVGNTAVEFVDTDKQEDDRSDQRVSLELGYTVNPQLRLRAATSLAEIDYDNVERVDEERKHTLGLYYQVARAWGIGLETSDSLVESNRPNVNSGLQEDVDIEERTVSLSLVWQPQTKLAVLRKQYERMQIENVLQ